jgi:type I restriction enzyme S subunit
MKAGWQRQRLASVAVKITDGSHNPPKGVPESDFLMLSSKNVFDDDLHYAEPRYLTAEQYQQEDKRTGIIPGDVLLTIVGTVGRSAVVPSDAPRMTLQRSVAVIRPISEIVKPRFLMYSFMERNAELNELARGVAQKGIYLETLRELEVMLPPLPEQHRIVAILDEAFDGIATAKANAEKNLQNARALFESHLQSVFTERGEGWVETTLDKISTNLDSKRIPITKNVRSSGEYPYYGASGIVDYVADYIFEGDNLLVSEDGANLLARSTPIAFSVTGKYWVNNHAHILHFENMATQRFAEFYLESIKLDEYITGAAQPKLNQKALNSIPVPFPKLVDEQAKIVGSIETLQEETQRLESLYQQKLTALDDLKKSLLHQAFSGQL